MNVRLLGLFMACGLSIPVAQAQMLQPGLWELSSSNMQVDGQQLPELQVMLGQLQNMLTPEQKAQLESQGLFVPGSAYSVIGLTLPAVQATVGHLPAYCWS